MRFHQLGDWIINKINIKSLVCLWYILALMAETRKHSLNYAAALSGLGKAQFGKFLSHNKKYAVCNF